MNKNSIIDKINALLAKTESNGATVEETMAAASKARELMVKYQIEESELNAKNKDGKSERAFRSASMRDAFLAILKPLNKFCGVKSTVICNMGSDAQRPIIFYGLKGDAVFAAALFDTLKSLRDRELAAFKKTETYKDAIRNGASAQQIKTQFTLAFTYRIDQMVELALKASAISGANALVPIREEAFADTEGNFGPAKGKQSLPAIKEISSESMAAGFEAGGKATLSKQLGSGAETRLAAK